MQKQNIMKVTVNIICRFSFQNQASGSEDNTKQYGEKKSAVTSGIMSLEIRDEKGVVVDVEGEVEMSFPNDQFEEAVSVNASAARDATTGLMYNMVNTSSTQSYIQLEIAVSGHNGLSLRKMKYKG